MATFSMRTTVRVAAIFAAAAVGVVGVPSVASAAQITSTPGPTQVVQFSTDGIHWSDSYTAQLFQGVRLVPNSSSLRSFYVRNGSTESALLRVTLADVTTNSIPLADAMTISTSTSGAPGATVAVDQAQPCYTLSQGLQLASGDSVRLDNTASLGDLNGTVGQNASVWFTLRVSFSSTDAAAPAPNDCPTDYGTVTTFPTPSIEDPTTETTSTSTFPRTIPQYYHRTAAGWTVGTAVRGGTTVTPTSPTTPVTPSTPLEQTLVANTARLYQEYDVAFWLAMSALGWAVLLLVRRRRAEDQPESPRNDRQIGNRP